MSVLKFSLDCSARPPETITLALVSSGRSSLAISAPAKAESPASPVLATFSMVPEPPSGLALSNAVVRTVRTSLVSLVVTVAIARSEEHTSELQSLMRISYAVFCLKKKKETEDNTRHTQLTCHQDTIQ